MGSPFSRTDYDVVIAGARCAGASTAMLLARRGLRVLVVDPVRYGTDTLSTHALMRGAVLQLHRWGLLDRVRAVGTPPIGSTTFHYEADTTVVQIESKDGVDALFAPRRTVLDPILVDAAVESGAEVVHGQAVVDLLFDSSGRVCGVKAAGSDREVTEVRAALVVGADGIRSRVARLAQADTDYTAPHAACSIYGYWADVPLDGYHWFYSSGASIGTIPTNDHATCVFALIPGSRFVERRHEGIDALHREALEQVSPELAESVETAGPVGTLRAFAGAPGHLRRATGPGWALVGDAGYFRDPITAHGISDALREAELLALAITRGDLTEYQQERDTRVRGLLDVTDRLASFDWDVGQARQHHLELNRQMNAQVDVIRSLD